MVVDQSLCGCGSGLRAVRCCGLDLAALPLPGAGAPLLPVVERAVELHRRGVLGEAAKLCRDVLELAPEMKAPVLGLYGGKDQGIPVDQVEQMRAALKAANKAAEIIIYPDAGHGFNADYRPSYNEAAAKDAWAHMLAWFRKYGVA